MARGGKVGCEQDGNEWDGEWEWERRSWDVGGYSVLVLGSGMHD